MKTPVKIRVDLSTREALKDIGRKGESYDAVIWRLISSWGISQNTEKAMKEILDVEEVKVG